jgi:hypothetical protein
LKIRWINIEVVPNTSEKWLLFICKHTWFFILLAILFLGIGIYFWQLIAKFENGEITTIYLGRLKPFYQIFGKWGITGFFLFLVFCCLYLFWIYAIKIPKNRSHEN